VLEEQGRAAVLATARDVLAELDELAAALVDVVIDRLGSEVADGRLHESLRASTIANVTLIVGMLGSGADPRSATPPPQALRFAVDFARAGHAAADFLRVYRVGQAELSAQWSSRLRAHVSDADTLASASDATSTFLFELADTLLVPLLAQYESEAATVAARIESMRAETIRELLSAPQPDVQAASARLRYEIDRWHVGVAVWVPAGPDHSTRLDEAVAAAGRGLGRSPLVIPAAGDVVHAWISMDREPRSLDPPGVPGAIIALGRPGHRLPGFRRSRRDAVRALELARALHRAPGSVTNYRDVEVLALLYADGDEARRFAADVLAPVLAEGAIAASLIETLTVLHDADLNVGRAAERLAVHRNTVNYRVHRFLDLVGESDPGSLRVRAAVALAPLVISPIEPG
jgi:PucR C-terminal helix-turn-helix domain/GGDEF-like domain